MAELREEVVMDTDIAELWLQYIKTKDIGVRNAIILKYSEIVKKIAFRMCRAYHVFDISEELINEGIIALIQSVDKFDLSRNVKFETFASRRVHGSMLDFINKQNGYIRKIHDMTKNIHRAKEALRLKLQREPSNAEIAKHLEISEDQLEKDLFEIQPISIISLSQTKVTSDMDEMYLEIPAASESDPFFLIDSDELCDNLVACIEKLNNEQQLVLSLFYKEELTIKEIAEIMQTETTRISQIRFQAIKKLKRLLNSTEKRISI